MSKELTALPEADPLTTDTLLYVVDGDGNSRKVALSDLAQWIKTAESIVPESEPFRGALVKRTSNLSVSGSTVTNVTWQAAEYDTDSFWSGGNPSRLTVPSGVSRVRVRASGFMSGGAANTSMWLRKNGSNFYGMGHQSLASGWSDNRTTIASAVVDVSAGDYFEVVVYYSAARTLTADERSWMSIEVVEALP